MGRRIFYEGDREQGIRYVRGAVDLMAKTDRDDTDHLTHGQMVFLAGLYNDMKDYASALQIDEQGVRLTNEGTRWGRSAFGGLGQQQRDRRLALAKLAMTLAKMKRFQRADSAYAAWEAVEYEGNHARDYFIVDYLRERGRYAEAAAIYKDLISRIRQQGDTLGDMMNAAKRGLAEVLQKSGDHSHAAELYAEALEINDTLRSRQAHDNAQELAATYHAQEQQIAIEQEKAASMRSRFIVMIVVAGLLALALYTERVVRQKRLISEKNRVLAQQIAEALKLSEKLRGCEEASAPSDLGGTMSDEQLYRYVTSVIERERLFLDPKFDRQPSWTASSSRRTVPGPSSRRASTQS